MKNSESFASNELAAAGGLPERSEQAFRTALTMSDLGKEGGPSLADSYLYRFGQFALDSRKRAPSRGDSPVSLTPKAFDVLLFLVKNPNRLVTKEELLQAVWGDTVVEDGNLTQYISHLRKALGDNSADRRLIVTIARKGYQFAGNVVCSNGAGPLNQAAAQVSATERIANGCAALSRRAKDTDGCKRAQTPTQGYARALGDFPLGVDGWRAARSWRA
jgi:DNA-binding winged helix-turn-helix (wHTH) protein